MRPVQRGPAASNKRPPWRTALAAEGPFGRSEEYGDPPVPSGRRPLLMFSSPRPNRAMLSCALVAIAIAAPAGSSMAQSPVDAVTAPLSAQVETARTSVNGCANAGVLPTAANAAKARRATLCLLNKERTKRGLTKLRSQGTLGKVASSYAKKMVRDRFFDHVSPGGSTMVGRIKATAYLSRVRSWSVGENIAWGAGPQATPAAIMEAWMDSPGHRHNILDRGYREIGIGVITGVPVAGIGSEGATYVTEFGQRSR